MGGALAHDFGQPFGCHNSLAQAKVLKICQDLGVGAQFGGKYFAHDAPWQPQSRLLIMITIIMMLISSSIDIIAYSLFLLLFFCIPE